MQPWCDFFFKKTFKKSHRLAIIFEPQLSCNIYYDTLKKIFWKKKKINNNILTMKVNGTPTWFRISTGLERHVPKTITEFSFLKILMLQRCNKLNQNGVKTFIMSQMNSISKKYIRNAFELYWRIQKKCISASTKINKITKWCLGEHKRLLLKKSYQSLTFEWEFYLDSTNLHTPLRNGTSHDWEQSKLKKINENKKV